MNKLNTFQFTLILKNVNEKTAHLEDSLYEAGCDDALIHYLNGTVHLEFDREASSLEEAVTSAINNVEASTVHAQVAGVSPSNLVSESEIAKRLMKPRQTVSLWIKGERRSSFPHPVMRLSEKTSLWNWADVVNWLSFNKIIEDKNLIEDALFFANINAALEERDQEVRELRHKLLQRITMHGSHQKYG